MRTALRIKTLLLFAASIFAAAALLAQQPAPTDTAASAVPKRERKDYVLRMPVEMADTIPQDFFEIAEKLGLNRYTMQLVERFNQVPDKVILEVLAEADKQTEYRRANAYAVAYAIGALCREDSLWAAFFSDIDMQFREPNILRINFRDDQKWKSYVLNDLFYSTFFQELLLGLGNIGITSSRDGRQWLAGWPSELRWKYREYVFEYLPENVGIRMVDLRRAVDTGAAATDDAVRLAPTNPVLPVGVDSVEPPYRVPGP
ncbi:MAG: hypothetical protein V1794_18900 [Candidatus Glassbacteria bacterium]